MYTVKLLRTTRQFLKIKIKSNQIKSSLIINILLNIAEQLPTNQNTSIGLSIFGNILLSNTLARGRPSLNRNGEFVKRYNVEIEIF